MVGTNTLTLYNWLQSWVETYAKPKVRQRTCEGYTSQIYHTEPLWNMPIQKITPNHLQNLYNNMQEEGFSGETRKKVHQMIRNALRRAVINKYLQSNPADLVDTPKVVREEIQIFTPTEIELLLFQAKKDWKQFPSKNFHTLRHTFATTLLANNVPITDVSRALGHARVSTTLDIYECVK